jgi:hypothetical protein
LRKSIIIAAVAALGTMAFAATGANAAVSQQVVLKTSAAAGGGTAKGNNFVKLNAYLSTRDSASTRTAKKAAPVAKVVMTFPAGSTTQAPASPCTESAYLDPTPLSSACAATAKIGDGWALIRGLSSNPITYPTPSAVSERPADCLALATDPTQYDRTFESTLGLSTSTAGGKPSCQPRGLIWARVSAYAGASIPTDKNGTPLTPTEIRDSSIVAGTLAARNTAIGNKCGAAATKKPCKWTQFNNAIIFANNTGGVANTSFPGIVTGGNVLTVNLPALAGAGSNPGELYTRTVLSDFGLRITSASYLKLGPCPSNHQVTTTTVLSYSKFSNESIAAPANMTKTATENCVS